MKNSNKFGIQALVIATLMAVGGVSIPVAVRADSEVKVVIPDSKFQVVQPGKLTTREQSLVSKYLADNAALKSRGPIDIQKLIRGELPKDTPGLGPVIHVTEEWVRYNNAKYDPENPLLNDRAYAQKHGYENILAYPTFGAHDDTFMVPYPNGARDTLLVSDLNHSVTTLKPIYPGDTLYLVADERDVIDLTPEKGSIYRSVAINTKGSVYNQRGEKVNEVIFRVTESVKQYKDPKDAPKNPGFFDVWEAPNWMSRPAVVYSDANWEKIRSIWAGEKRQGSAPKYWEDVSIGDRPTITLDGPVLSSVSPVPPWGQGSGGSRTMKREIMNPTVFGSMIRGSKDGIYRLSSKEDYVPIPPKQAAANNEQAPAETGAIVTTDIHKDGESRSPLVNYMGRDLAIRHLNNWMGDHGWLHNIRWSIMDPRAFPKYGKEVPRNPEAVHYLDQVPGMNGRHVTEHGLTQDVAIVKSEVVAKSIKNGSAYVDLVWWIETIDGKIWEEGGATIKLPTKKK